MPGIVHPHPDPGEHLPAIGDHPRRGAGPDYHTILEQVVADRERLLGDDHPDTLTALATLDAASEYTGKDAAG